MKILAIDTATEAVSAALLIDGEVLERYRHAPREHAQLLLPFVDEVLAEADVTLGALDFIAVSRGPGSFTGVRIGFSAAQGMAMGAGLGLVPVSTLQALALTAHDASGKRPPQVLAGLDARMDEIYAGFFDFADNPVGTPVGEEMVIDPGALTAPAAGTWYGVGSAFSAHGDTLQARLGSALAETTAQILPRAAAVAKIGARMSEQGTSPVPAESAQPVYLRNRVAEKPT